MPATPGPASAARRRTASRRCLPICQSAITKAGRTTASRTCRKFLRPAGEKIGHVKPEARDAAGLEAIGPVEIDITKSFTAQALPRIRRVLAYLPSAFSTNEPSQWASISSGNILLDHAEFGKSLGLALDLVRRNHLAKFDDFRGLRRDVGRHAGELRVGIGEGRGRFGEFLLLLEVGPDKALERGTLAVDRLLRRHEHAKLGADRFRRAVFEALGEITVTVHHGNRFERLPGDEAVDLALLQGLVEIGAAALNVDGLKAVVGNAVFDQRCGKLKPDRRARRDRDLLALQIVPAIELHAVAADHIFRRRADAHQPDHIGRSLRQRDRKIGRPDRGRVERTRQQRRARIGVTDELDQLEIDAELLQFVGDENDRRQMADLLVADRQFDRLRQRRRLGSDRAVPVAATIRSPATSEGSKLS